MTQLRLADDLLLPLEAVTQTFAILAKRGVGKTHTAAVLAEELLKAGLQVVVLDPLDVWYGLRSSVNGEQAGLPIVVLGGTHGDLPLDAGAGNVLADLVVEGALSAVLSLRHLSKGDQRRLVTDFCERLYHRKGEDRYRQPVHLIIDEADAYVPQRVYAGQERMVGAIDDLVRRGRASGIGVTLITQRAAVIHKDVLTQIEVLIALRTISPQDRKAVELWIEAHDAYDQRAEFIASLASLPIGTAWVWSPGWLDVFRKVAIRRRETFDSSATPKVGEAPRAPRELATVDLAALRERLAATIAQVEAEDPAALRRRIADLERQVRERPVPAAPERVEVPVLPESHLLRLEQVGGKVAKATPYLIDVVAYLEEVVRTTNDVRERARGLALGGAPGERTNVPPVTVALPRSPTEVRPKLAGGERRVLTVLAQYPSGRTKGQVALLAGYAVGGGGYNNILSALRSRGWISGSNELAITEDGRAALGSWETLPTGRALLDYWLGKLGRAERAILTALVNAYPAVLSREELGQRTGYEPTGGGFNNALGRLRTLELVAGRGALQAAAELAVVVRRES